MILVPIKNLTEAKQRLSPALSPSERCQLAHAMIEDVLTALAGCALRNSVAVVTGDADARSTARQHAFEVIEDAQNPGETGAIEAATRYCSERGADFTLVLPGDIPLITADEVDAIFAHAPQQGSVLVPSSSQRGTNAALRRPADLFPLRFGNDSFVPHHEAATRTGHPVRVLKLPGIGLDVDEPQDLLDLLAAGGTTRAQQLLRGWRMDERIHRGASA